MKVPKSFLPQSYLPPFSYAVAPLLRPLAPEKGQARYEKHRENGATRLKRRLLERVGWRVISVRHWEWEEASLAAGAEGQRAYLEGLLCQPATLPNSMSGSATAGTACLLSFQASAVNTAVSV